MKTQTERKAVIVYLVICLFCLLNVVEALAQEEQEVSSAFQKKIEKFEKFFSSKPKLLLKREAIDTPTGTSFFYDRFDDYKISYEFSKTGSAITPFAGHITVDYLAVSSLKCGDFDITGGKAGYVFTTLELARQKRDEESCYAPLREPSSEGLKETRRTVKFVFQFQKKAWVFKGVLSTDNRPTTLEIVFNKPPKGWFYVEDNDFWKELIK
jgi:hypothetical protein